MLMPPVLAENEVHAWQASLDPAPPVLARLAAHLSSDEMERANRFRFEHLKNRFIAGRGLLREILGRYLQAAPAALKFVYGPQGKPDLSPQSGKAQIHFNISHCEQVGLIAVTSNGPVGIDVERVRFMKDIPELVARFFSPRETRLFQTLPPDIQVAAFFNLWTRKEALLKATGEGIACSLDRVEVSFLPAEPPRLLSMADDSAEAAQWTLHDVPNPAGFVGTVAIRATNVAFRAGQWE
jgi:4'-phosphopantetheinyl transferase